MFSAVTVSPACGGGARFLRFTVLLLLLLPTPTTSIFFFFNDTATTEIYTLSLHDALPISAACLLIRRQVFDQVGGLDDSLTVAFNDVDFCLRVRAAGYLNLWTPFAELIHQDRKSTRLNSSHDQISYAVFCLKKKKKNKRES